MADLLGLSSSDRVAMGGWSSSSEALASASSTARRLRMPLRYSGVRLQASAVIKVYIIKVVESVLAAKVPPSSWSAFAASCPEHLGPRRLLVPDPPPPVPLPISSGASFGDDVVWFHGLQPSAAIHLKRVSYAFCRVSSSGAVHGKGEAEARLTGRLVCERCLEAFRKRRAC